jgi:TM2 domain-containing membrane protein YozV
MMKKTTCFFSGFLLLSFIVLFTSAVPASRGSVPDTRAASASVNTAVTPTPAPGTLAAQKVTYQQLKTVATELKGSKLTFKERVALKLFGKKIVSKMAASKRAFGGGYYSQLTALLLCFFVGSLGVHRFYLGYTWQGIVQLLTLGGCGIWSLIDFIRICTGDLQPKDGQYDTTL